MLQKRNKSIVAKTSSVLLVMVTLFSASSNAVAGPKPKPSPSPSPSSSYQVLHVFSNAGDGQVPMAGVQANAAGQLFGSTEFGGAHGFGSIFMLQPPLSGTTTWTEKVIFSFADGNDGGFPGSGLSINNNGQLLSSTLMGGTANHGNIFRLSPPVPPSTTWTENVLLNFTGAPDGDGPLGDLLVQADGTVLGTTSAGGVSNAGAVFRFVPSPTGTATQDKVLFSFDGSLEGSRPQVGVVTDGNGNFFGTTEESGQFNNGVVFEITPSIAPGTAATETTIFQFNLANGSQPVGSLFAFGGSLYGVTFTGGAFNQGVIFQLTPPSGGGMWIETILHSFSGGVDGGEPQSGLLPDGHGGFFGTASQGGTSGNGNFFHLTPPAQPGGTWTLTPLHQFAGGNDGAVPGGDLLEINGAIFGTTQGSTNAGTVYKIIP
jgi:uncharacterized repeat protein (TIGR03803 family)